MNDDNLRRRIEERAHAIWESQGRVDGHHDEHWRQAESEIAAEASQAGATPDTAAAPRGRQAARRKGAAAST